MIAGRDGAAAASFADRLGAGARARQVQVDDAGSVAAALDGVEVVYSCVDATTAVLVDAVVERGLGLVDISADRQVIARARARSDRARRTGARVVVGAGLHPGIVNVLARRAVERVGPGGSVTTVLVVSAGDAFGPAAVEYMLEAGADGGFVQPVRVELGSGWGVGRALRFPFPDADGYVDTLGVTRAEGRVVVRPASVGAAVHAMGATGVARLGRSPRFRRAVGRAVGSLTGRGTADAGTVALAVNGDAWWRCSVRAPIGESAMTAIGTVVAGALLDEVPPGVWWPQEAFDPDRFVASLADHGLELDEEGRR